MTDYDELPETHSPGQIADLLRESDAAYERVKARAERLAGALRPFAELADLFDDGMRGGNMPSADHHTVMSWPRLKKNYEFSVGDLRTARTALQEQPHDD